MAFEASVLDVRGKTFLGHFRDKALGFRICYSQSSIYCEEEHSHFRVPLILPPLPSDGSPEHWQTFLSSCFGRFLKKCGLQVFPKFSGGGSCFSKSNQSNSNTGKVPPDSIKKPQISLVNIQDIPHFTGRKIELKQLKDILRKKKIVRIGGIEGSGKTALASTFVLSLANKFDVVWKCTADTEVNVLCSLRQMGKILRLRDSNRDLHFFLKSHLVLLLLDDLAYDKPEQLKSLLELNVTIIATMREGWKQDIDLNIDGLTAKAAVNFVVGLTKREAERQEIDSLCQELDFLPLALKNVSALLNSAPSTRVKKFIRKIRKAPADSADSGTTHKIKWVLEECVKKVTSESGKRLLLLTLDLSPTVIPEQLYKEVFAGEVKQLEEAMIETLGLSLIEKDEQLKLSLHPLVQKAIRSVYPNQDLLPAKLLALFHLFDCTQISELSANLQKSISGVLMAVRNERSRGNLGNPSFNLSEPTFLLLSIRSLYFLKEKLEIEISDTDFAECQVWANMISAVTAETVTDLEYLAVCCKGVKDYKLAEQYMSEAIEFRERDPIKEKLADLFTTLATIYDSHFPVKDSALEYYKKALEIKEATLPPIHPALGFLYEKCATAYFSQGKWTAAEEFYMKSVKNKETYLPLTHPDFSDSYTSLLSVYQQQGDNGKYEQLLLKLLRDREALLPSTHKDIGSVCLLLAQFYEKQKKKSKAVLFNKRAQDAGAIVEESNNQD